MPKTTTSLTAYHIFFRLSIILKFLTYYIHFLKQNTILITNFALVTKVINVSKDFFTSKSGFTPNLNTPTQRIPCPSIHNTELTNMIFGLPIIYSLSDSTVHCWTHHGFPLFLLLSTL